MTQKELNEVLALHKKWIKGEDGGVRANLIGTNLSGADLVGTNLSGTNLSGTNLRVANLRRANLIGANLNGADLSGADLSKADLSGADLSKADLSGANLRGANLSGANLNGAYLSGANLNGALGLYIFSAIDTSRRIVYCVRHETTWMIKAGCFWGTLDELEAKVKSTHNSKVYLANIEILRGLQ